ncbi:MAG: phosphotransacetylase family protein, partial [Anaerolineales bacterium]
MNSIYVMSIEPFSGKTAVCLALSRHFLNQNLKVGYLKPISFQPWRIGKHIADEDAAFVKDILNLPEQPWELSKLVITPEYLKKRIRHQEENDIFEDIKSCCDQAQTRYDIYVIEGGSSLREGYIVGLQGSVFAENFHCQILMLIRYHNDAQLLDDALAAKSRLQDNLHGVIINRVNEESFGFIKNEAQPYLENLSIPVFGILPEVRSLAALTVGEIVNMINAQVLTNIFQEDALVENLTIGAMTAEAALSRFRKQLNKAVITGGDRTDIQLAALETSTTCLILTGNLHPSPLIVKQAEEFGVTVILVPYNTMETIQ